ncbi:MAG: hypothetical protein ABWY12_04585 [Burkholderiales bacterium]
MRGLLASVSGRVVGVPDGDTLTFLDSSSRQHNVRLSGVDLGRVGPVP